MRTRTAASAFGRSESLPDCLSFDCLDCNRERDNRWYREHRRRLGKEVRDHSGIPDGFRWCADCMPAVAHEAYTRNSKTVSGYGSRCKACHGAANSDAYFYRRYRITKREVADLRAAQDDRCGTCGDPHPEHLDHDHSTGRVRRLLCQRCNHGLGLFRDDPYLLHVAALDAEGHRQQHALSLLQGEAASEPEGPSRPGAPPVGSQRRPGTQRTSARSTGRTSGARRREQAGEADT